MEKAALVLRRNWFKFFIVGVLAFFATQKDLQVRVKFKENPTERIATPTASKAEITAPAQQSTLLERFQFNLFSKKEQSSADTKQNPTSSHVESQGNALASVRNLSPETRDAFVRRFAQVALNEQQKYGIPASIVLGHSLLMSEAGSSYLSEAGNNYFATPCTTDWEEGSILFRGNCFREYETAWMSFRDNSLYLTTGRMSAFTKDLGHTDYRGWAKSLQRAGVAQQEKYGQQLIQLIEDMGLHHVDQQ